LQDLRVLNDAQTHYYQLLAVRKQLVTEGLHHVGATPVTRQQLAKLQEGPGATVAEWPTIGMMVEDHISKKKAEVVIREFRAE
jgi:hypothetical protein